MYSINVELKEPKAMHKWALKKITFDDSRKCLFNNIEIEFIKKSIVLKFHDVFAI